MTGCLNRNNKKLCKNKLTPRTIPEVKTAMASFCMFDVHSCSWQATAAKQEYGCIKDDLFVLGKSIN